MDTSDYEYEQNRRRYVDETAKLETISDAEAYMAGIVHSDHYHAEIKLTKPTTTYDVTLVYFDSGKKPLDGVALRGIHAWDHEDAIRQARELVQTKHAKPSYWAREAEPIRVEMTPTGVEMTGGM